MLTKENKIKSVIIDDDESNLSNLELLINNYCPGVEVTGMASTADDAVKIIKNKTPDLVFLDVEIKNKTGFDVLEQFEKVAFNVIFITAFDKYAIKALRFSAVDYLLKPINIDELARAVQKVQEKHKQAEHFQTIENLLSNLKKQLPNTQRLALPMSGKLEFVQISEIVRCVGESSYTTFHLKDGTKKIVSKTLKEYEELLKEFSFLRVHKSNLVNMNYAKSLVKGSEPHLIMDDGSIVEISSLKRQEVINYMLG